MNYRQLTAKLSIDISKCHEVNQVIIHKPTGGKDDGANRVTVPCQPNFEGIDDPEAARAYHRASRWPQFRLGHFRWNWLDWLN
jgi:hypothetical protein